MMLMAIVMTTTTLRMMMVNKMGVAPVTPDRGGWTWLDLCRGNWPSLAFSYLPLHTLNLILVL